MENARQIDSEPSPKEGVVQLKELAPKMKKRVFLSGFLALFPGMGNVYNGLYMRGGIFFTIIASLLALATSDHRDHPVLGFTVAFAWLFNIIDSIRQAQLINIGAAQDLGLEDLPKAPKAGQGGLLAGVLMLVIGITASLEIYFGVDLSWMIRFWPVGLILFGSILIAVWFKGQKKEEEI